METAVEKHLERSRLEKKSFNISEFLTLYLNSVVQATSTLKAIDSRRAKTLFFDKIKRIQREKYPDVQLVSSPDDAVWEAVSVLAINQKTSDTLERATAEKELGDAENASQRILETPNKRGRQLASNVLGSDEETPETDCHQEIDAVTLNLEVECSTTLTKEWKENFRRVFDGMNSERKWRLNSGKCVEDALFKFGATCTQEHACHSFIIDPDDATYTRHGVFNEEELQEIRTFAVKPVREVPKRVMDFFDEFSYVVM